MDITPLIDAAISAISSVAVEQVVEGLKDIIHRNIPRTTLNLTEEELEKNIIDEIRKTSNWASDDLFKNHNNHSDITSRYVHLDLLLTPHRELLYGSQGQKKQPLCDIIKENNGNTVILGQPGSGKTTSVKFLVNSIIKDPVFLSGVYRFPVVIRLRELNKSNSILGEQQDGGIFEKLSLIFGLKFHIDHIIRRPKKDSSESPIDTTKEDKEKLRVLLKTKLIPYILDTQKILLILDGFDEIMDDKIKRLVISELRELANSLNESCFILTSRTADYKLELENTNVYEISELTTNQVKEFAEKWFEDSVLSQEFLKELYAKMPYEDFYTRPLLLTQVALIYTRTNEIPSKPKMIYQRIVELVLKEWNEKQGLKRKSKYASFTVERKREFLSAMAFNLTIKYNKHTFSKDQLSIIYKELNRKFRELPIDEVGEVIEEIETHNGLIVQSGYDSFEFSHLTIQEFFVADYIVRTSSVRKFKYSDMIKIPNELALAIALSSEPYLYLLDILEVISKNHLDDVFLSRFFNRIRLENPDFESDALIVVALLSTYTKICDKYIALYNHRFREPNYRTKERQACEDIDILEKIIIQVSNGEVNQLLKGCYHVKNGLKCIAGMSFITYERDFNAGSILGGYDVPKILYWNDNPQYSVNNIIEK